MNKIYLSLTFVATLLLSSCGDTPEQAQAKALCGCAEKTLEMQKEMKGMEDMSKMEAVIAKYEKDFKTCETVFEKLGKEMEKLTDDQRKAKEEELLNSCDAFKTLKSMQDKAMKEQEAEMKKMQESLNDLQNEGAE